MLSVPRQAATVGPALGPELRCSAEPRLEPRCPMLTYSTASAAAWQASWPGLAALVVTGWCLGARPAAAESPASDGPSATIEEALRDAGANRSQLVAALDRAPRSHKRAMRFLIAHMPPPDRKTLSARFLLENTAFAYRAWKRAPWRDAVPEELFLNYVLPYASVNERRDAWRKDFYRRFRPLVRDAKSPSAACALLNNKVFPLLKVRYSTKRPKADQSPYESVEAGMASCTGLSVLLVDACRAVGVPARFVGTNWTDKSGNHSWVEVWDDGWHFTGAAEPTGDQLDRAWFVQRAADAKRDDPRHAIYAASYKRTPLRFPLSWKPGIDYVHALNVTDRYTAHKRALAKGQGRIYLRVLERSGAPRTSAKVRIYAGGSKPVFEGQSKDERFDANDHLTAPLVLGKEYRVEVSGRDTRVTKRIQAKKDEQLVTLELAKSE